MTCLLVFAFTNEEGAAGMLPSLQSLQEQQLIDISDAAIVIRKPDSKIKIKQINSLVGKGSLEGAFWGLLISLSFFMPWSGIATGSAGFPAGTLTDYGINDRFIKEVGITIRTCYSVLFLMVVSMTEERVIEASARHKATFLRAQLSEEEETRLREAYGTAESDE